ncbi:N-acetylmuramoyl-L-alanine amidase [Salmonella enterica]|nr:N-acetylmuramoyl-L-alanine amidase [Salmonella enterica]HCM1832754.1 N-acetylmuramoyl-L-alanine amidase [Salmonella enterica subsp. salamae serovar 48:z81:z39]HCM1885259.1 N-acetylmuramoyl-L-alanine amidase [Salmonella enterica subsp. salamae serovar 60:z10:z39]EAX8457720.1 N-acetylmuramoyl-L-alanine amidase [Salmonella enterica]EAX8555952.1 N-acetylmuramoyl-L-alanine amidase [Salmonella enterica]
MADDSTAGAVKTKNPSPLVYDKEKNNGCKFEEITTSDEKNKDKDCRKTVIYVDSDGYIQNAEITKKTVKELEHGKMDKINAILLHRTKSSSEDGTFESFRSKKEGTHFVVAKNGCLYQTASLFEWTPHIGKIKSRCQEEKTWSAEERKKIQGFGWDPKRLYVYELEKNYPDRYPYNEDSVGIEVVADHVDGSWEKATPEQRKSIAKIVDILMNIYELQKQDIYEHDKISYKTAGEGADLYDYS